MLCGIVFAPAITAALINKVNSFLGANGFGIVVATWQIACKNCIMGAIPESWEQCSRTEWWKKCIMGALAPMSDSWEPVPNTDVL